jgi:hypothetical protein
LGYASHPGCLLFGRSPVRRPHGGSGTPQTATNAGDPGGKGEQLESRTGQRLAAWGTASPRQREIMRP